VSGRIKSGCPLLFLVDPCCLLVDGEKRGLMDIEHEREDKVIYANINLL
jgi:hypothetical protein